MTSCIYYYYNYHYYYHYNYHYNYHYYYHYYYTYKCHSLLPLDDIVKVVTNGDCIPEVIMHSYIIV